MTQTVDEILGPPSVDDILGPTQAPEPAPPIAGVRNSFAMIGSDPKKEREIGVVDRFFANTSMGRAIGAFGQGLKDGFGADRIGLSEESEKAFRDIGLFRGAQTSLFDSFKLFNESIIRPAAVAADTTVRSVNALYHGVGEAAISLGVPRDIVSIPEAFAGSPHFSGVPHVERPVAPAVRTVDEATPVASEAAAAAAVPDAAPGIRLFHGTQQDFAHFDPTRRGEDIGVHFSTDPEVAKGFGAGTLGDAGQTGLPMGPTTRLIDVQADIENPLRTPDLGTWEAPKVAKYLVEQGIAPAGFVNEVRLAGDRDFAPGRAAQNKVVTDFLKSKGYDAIVYDNKYEGGGDSYLIFDFDKVRQTEPPPAAAEQPQPQPRITAAESKPATPDSLYDKADDGVVDRAGNINLERIAAPEDVKNVITEVAEKNGGFTEARRAPMTFGEISDLADAVGMTPETLVKRKVGEAFNAEQALAARNLLVQSATNVRELALKAQGGSEADLLAFQEAMTRHTAIQEQVAGMTAEAGRALASFRIAAGNAANVSSVIEEFGGRARIEDIAKKLTELDTPQQVSKFLADARRAKPSDMLIEAWINALLSNPVTHAANIIGNTGVAIWSPVETFTAAGVSAARRAVGLGSDGVLFGEAGARLFGIAQGAKEGVVAAWRTYRTERPTIGNTKIDARNLAAIPSKEVAPGIEIGGKQLRIPTRLLTAEDELFNAFGYRQELNALAYRQAAREGLRGDEFAQRAATLVANPTDAMVEAARANAKYQTFQTDLGRTGKAIQEFANSHPLAKVVVPFVRTPANLLKYANERTPLGVFARGVRDNLTGKNGQAAQDTQIARMALGTAMGVAAFTLAAEGNITGGGPTDPHQRAMWLLAGNQPYSVKIGDTWYSYQRFAPFSTLVGVAADGYAILQAMHADDPEHEHFAALLFAAVTKNVTNQTWLQGVSDLVQAVQDPERYGQRYIDQLAGSFIPAGVAQIARVQDPTLRDARTLVDTLKSRLPGLSTDVMPKRDIWGEPITREGALGPDMVSPIFQSRISNDPVNRELMALRIWPAPVQRDIHGVKLTPEQYDEYQRVSGRFTKFNLDGLVAMGGWSDVPPGAREEMIRNVIRESRKAATTAMVFRHPELLQATIDKKLKVLAPAN